MVGKDCDNEASQLINGIQGVKASCLKALF